MEASVSLSRIKSRTVYVRDDMGLAESPFMSEDGEPGVSRDEFEKIAWTAASEKSVQ